MEYQSIVNFEHGNLPMHPFIIDLGSHSSIIADNTLNNKVHHYAFKTGILAWFEDFYRQQKHGLFMNYFENYAIFFKQKSLFKQIGLAFDTSKNSIIDRAVELGVQLDYEAMEESFKQTMEATCGKKTEEDYTPFFLAMNSLEQICLLKVLESRVLYIFRDDIQREGEGGSISILSAIQNTANAIYLISQSPDAFLGKVSLRKELKRFEKKLDGYKVIGEKEKEDIMSSFVSLSMSVYENTINNMYYEGNEKVDEYCTVMNNNIGNLIKNNFDIVDQIKGAVEKTPNPNSFEDNESMEYVAKTDYKDPSIR